MRYFRRPPESQGGFTLTELSVAIGLIALASTIAYSGFITMVRTTRGVADRSIALESAKSAVETIGRDLRAANPIDAVSPVALYDTQVGFTVFCSSAGVGQCDSLHRLHVQYQVVNHSLQRVMGSGANQTTATLVGPMGPGTVPLALQPGALIHDSAQPVFRYYDRSNNLLSTSANGGAPSTSFRDCAKTLEIHIVLIALPNKDQPTYDIDTKILLRNYHLVTGC